MALDFAKIGKTIQTVIDDVSTLEVATLTNKSTGNIDLSSGNNTDIFTSIKSNLGQADLVAYTKFEIEGDSINFLNNKEELASLVDKHASFVSSALETRKAFFETIIKTVKDLIP